MDINIFIKVSFIYFVKINNNYLKIIIINKFLCKINFKNIKFNFYNIY